MLAQTFTVCKSAPMNNTAEADLISTAEVAALLDTTVATVNRWAAAGKLPVVRKMPGRTGQYVFDRAAIQSVTADSGGIVPPQRDTS